MSDPVLPGDPPISIRLRRSGRARRISLRISQLDGRVTLTLPSFVAEAEALDFARSKESWIRDHLSQRAPEVLIAPGAELPFAGELLQIRIGAGRGVQHSAGVITVPERNPTARLRAWLREQARARLVGASDFYAQRLGRSYSRITLRDTRSRWGSCSSQGALMYSWRLILAPPEILRYVAAHEVAHLAEMNHSQAFWDCVRDIHGPYEAPRRWLREQGNALHRYRFES